jgi:hypothetical protein
MTSLKAFFVAAFLGLSGFMLAPANAAPVGLSDVKSVSEGQSATTQVHWRRHHHWNRHRHYRHRHWRHRGYGWSGFNFYVGPRYHHRHWHHRHWGYRHHRHWR